MFQYFRFAHPELYRQFSEQSIPGEIDQDVEVDEIDKVQAKNTNFLTRKSLSLMGWLKRKSSKNNQVEQGQNIDLIEVFDVLIKS